MSYMHVPTIYISTFDVRSYVAPVRPTSWLAAHGHKAEQVRAVHCVILEAMQDRTIRTHG